MEEPHGLLQDARLLPNVLCSEVTGLIHIISRQMRKLSSKKDHGRKMVAALKEEHRSCLCEEKPGFLDSTKLELQAHPQHW